jgi:hypothetical protein
MTRSEGGIEPAMLTDSIEIAPGNCARFMFGYATVPG